MKNNKINLSNCDTTHIRQSIFEFLKNNSVNIEGKVLDVGCGSMPYKTFFLKVDNVSEYIGLDIENEIYQKGGLKPDLLWDGKKIPLADNCANTVILTEVLEHCFHPEEVLKECFRVLNREGKILITVPFIWNLHDSPHDYYRFTPYWFQKVLKQIGFSEIKVIPHGGWDASLAQMMGLWLKRSNISAKNKNLLSYIILPAIRYLYNRDSKRRPHSIPTMFTGLGCVAKKQVCKEE